MNIASIWVICIVTVLLAFAIAGVRKKKTSECAGTCAECAFQCRRKPDP